ncbi:hypothetical protein GWK47_050025 [Chionoecetes opilio]|uniref:Uncharacterized protein n=1 Tax=Chionoecetes opilio TaxID=41210 RepID=A0A8J4Y8S0_CHIOP|nr:hypothetical protein GWK47_050025 [Chionoecetes opilio]
MLKKITWKIYDSNVVIRMLPFPRKEEDATFKDLASDFTAFVLQKASQIGTPSQIHLIFDRYYEESVKSQARINRGGNDQAVAYNIAVGGRVHVNKDTFLSNSCNKAALARVYTEYLSSTADLPQGLEVYTSGGNDNHAARITAHKIETVPELESNHEESDTSRSYSTAYMLLAGIQSNDEVFKALSSQALSSLGTGKPTTNEVNAAHKFVVALYGGREETLLELRCKLALRKVAPQKLPPTENSLYQHILRVAYQLFVWKKAATGMLEVKDVTKFGWERNVDTKQLQPIMMTQPCAPPELLNDILCCCEDCNEDCSCLVNNQSCTADCVCRAALPGVVNMDEDDFMCANPLTLSAFCEMSNCCDSD